MISKPGCQFYQGAFSNGVWNIYHIPIADDWYAFRHPARDHFLVYVNDLDGVANRNLWIDSIRTYQTMWGAALGDSFASGYLAEG